MTIDDISFTTKTIMDVVEDGFDQIDDGEGFEYIVGHIKRGKLKVVFEPNTNDHECSRIDGVEGFGYILAFDANAEA